MRSIAHSTDSSLSCFMELFATFCRCPPGGLGTGERPDGGSRSWQCQGRGFDRGTNETAYRLPHFFFSTVSSSIT
jgi:hypothetical protein